MKAAISLVAIQIHIPSGAVQDSRPESQQKTILNGKRYLRAGLVHTFDPTELRELEKYRAAIKNACREVGTRLMGMWAIPTARLPELEARLTQLSDEFQQARKRFLSVYEERVSAWANAAGNAEIKDLVLRHARSAISIQSDICFGFWSFNVESVTDAVDGGAETAAQDSLLHEIVVDAAQVWKKSLVKADVKNRKVFSPFIRIRDKVEGLVVLDPDLTLVVQHIDSVLAEMPKAGPIDGQALVSIKRLCRSLMDAEGIRETIMRKPPTNSAPVVAASPEKASKKLALNW